MAAGALLDKSTLLLTPNGGTNPVGTISADLLSLTCAPPGSGFTGGTVGLYGSVPQDLWGKYYFEVSTVDPDFGTGAYYRQFAAGVMQWGTSSAGSIDSHPLESFAGSAQSSPTALLVGRNAASPAWSGGIGSPLGATPTIRIAVDYINGKIWIGANGFGWINTAHTNYIDPLDDTQPTFTFTPNPSLPLIPFLSVYVANQLSAPLTATINFGATPFNYAAPAGFDWRYDSQMALVLPISSTISGGLSAELSLDLPTFDVAIEGGYSALELPIPVPVLVAPIVGVTGQAGPLDIRVPAPEVFMEGGSFAVEANLPTFDVAMSGPETMLGTISADLPAFDVDVEAVVAIVGELYGPVDFLDPQTSFISGVTGTVGNAIVTLPFMYPQLSGITGITGSLDADIIVLPELLVNGSTENVGSFSLALPFIDALFVGEGAAQFSETYVINMLTMALSLYEAYEFNSYAKIDGKYYAADSNGVHQLEASVGERVDAVFSTGHLTLGTRMQKRVSDFYAAMRADDDLLVRVSTDEMDYCEYTLSPYAIDRLKQRRNHVGKGLRGAYWHFEVANTNGADFDFDTMNIALAPTIRRL